MKKRIVVTGGRNYSNVKFVHSILDKFKNKYDFILIHGDASGLDTIAKEYCIENHIEQIPYPANWNDLSEPCKIKYTNGKPYNALAGFRRNELMITDGKPNLCLAFDGGKGTNDMINRCFKHKIPVIECKEESND